MMSDPFVARAFQTQLKEVAFKLSVEVSSSIRLSRLKETLKVYIGSQWLTRLLNECMVNGCERTVFRYVYIHLTMVCQYAQFTALCCRPTHVFETQKGPHQNNNN